MRTGLVTRAISEHPVITAVMIGCTAGGAVLGLFVLTDDWSVIRRLIGGAIGGAGVAFLLTVTRMMGAWD